MCDQCAHARCGVASLELEYFQTGGGNLHETGRTHGCIEVNVAAEANGARVTECYPGSAWQQFAAAPFAPASTLRL
jgi:hypothetical protein